MGAALAVCLHPLIADCRAKREGEPRSSWAGSQPAIAASERLIRVRQASCRTCSHLAGGTDALGEPQAGQAGAGGGEGSGHGACGGARAWIRWRSGECASLGASRERVEASIAAGHSTQSRQGCMAPPQAPMSYHSPTDRIRSRVRGSSGPEDRPRPPCAEQPCSAPPGPFPDRRQPARGRHGCQITNPTVRRQTQNLNSAVKPPP